MWFRCQAPPNCWVCNPGACSGIRTARVSSAWISPVYWKAPKYTTVKMASDFHNWTETWPQPGNWQLILSAAYKIWTAKKGSDNIIRDKRFGGVCETNFIASPLQKKITKWECAWILIFCAFISQMCTELICGVRKNWQQKSQNSSERLATEMPRIISFFLVLVPLTGTPKCTHLIPRCYPFSPTLRWRWWTK